ncbi:MAG: signal peptidase I [Clostridia bacterium]|nr:signal peptidase I [Clostridia bacterium]
MDEIENEEQNVTSEEQNTELEENVVSENTEENSEENNSNGEKGKHSGILWEIWSWTYSIVIAVVAVLLVKNFIFSTTIVKQTSMVPTLQENNMLVIDRLSQVRHVPLQRGDIVVLEAPSAIFGKTGDVAYYSEDTAFDKFKKIFAKLFYVKRVIGLPGEHIKIEPDAVYINGEEIDEPYVNPENSSNLNSMEMVIPEGYVFCMGDNRGSSADSRMFGAIPIDKIEGRIIFRFWPFNEFGTVD